MSTTTTAKITVNAIGGPLEITAYETDGNIMLRCPCFPVMWADKPPTECEHTRDLTADGYKMMWLRKELDKNRQ